MSSCLVLPRHGSIVFGHGRYNGHTKFVVLLFDTDHSVGLVASSEDCINMFVMTPKDECPCVELLGLILIVILQQRPDIHH